jgi:hypothetical protein
MSSPRPSFPDDKEDTQQDWIQKYREATSGTRPNKSPLAVAGRRFFGMTSTSDPTGVMHEARSKHLRRRGPPSILGDATKVVFVVVLAITLLAFWLLTLAISAWFPQH